MHSNELRIFLPFVLEEMLWMLQLGQSELNYIV